MPTQSVPDSVTATRTAAIAPVYHAGSTRSPLRSGCSGINSLIGLALLFMNAFVYRAGGQIDAAETAIWSVIAIIGAGWILVVMRRIRPVLPRWLPPSVWKTA